mmetsp:Transcript_16798/g.34011  ORF Transcript_16798/g.34011 Transcript_16798/m.34011 type:complete len:368 (+) Transcript_16798:669-1772(+)
MSEKTIRSGTSSGLSAARSAVARISSHAASKSVEPPHGAACSAFTLSSTLGAPLRSTQRGVLSKVIARCAKAGCVSSATTRPRPIAASIGVPIIEPDTSTSGTSLPRSIAFGRLARSAATASRPALAPPAASSTAASRAAAAAAIASRTPPSIACHCASIRSASRMESGARRAMHFCATSCGKSCFPLMALAPLARSASRRCCRAATRPSSSGWRLPVASCAGVSLPLSASLRKALRWRCRQSEATRANSISSHRPAAISTSVVFSALLSDPTSFRYLRAAAAAFAPPKSWAASLRESLPCAPLSKWPPSRGAYFPASVRLGVRFAAAAASSSAPSDLSWSASIVRQRSVTALGMPGTSVRRRRSFQ